MLAKASIQFFPESPQTKLDTGFRQYDTPKGRVWFAMSPCFA